MTETKVIHEIFDTFKLKRTQKGYGAFGDDAVFIPPSSSQDHLVLSTDSFTQGTHFDDTTPIESIGFKALVASISDIVAMGAQPSFFMLNLILPNGFKDSKRLISGLYEASKKYNISLLGGDVVCGDSLSLAITAGGYQPISQSLKNTGAKSADVIFTESFLGHALLGFEQHKKNLKGEFVDSFFYPETQVDLGIWLSKAKGVTSLRDISDGVVSELRQFCMAHELSVNLTKPEHKNSFSEECIRLGLDADEVSFKGGEEYNLMWTVDSLYLKDFLDLYEKRFKTSPVKIGEVVIEQESKIYFEPNQSLIDSIIPFVHFSS